MEFNVCPQGHKLPNWWAGSCLACALTVEGAEGTELTMENLKAAKRQLDDEKA